MQDAYKEYYLMLGHNIAYYRKQRHLTQEGLALKANISRAYISHIEAQNMDAEPSLDVLFRLCSILKIEPQQLFTEQDRSSK